MPPSVPAADLYTLGRFYSRLCDRYGESVAIKTPDRTFTYAAIDEDGYVYLLDRESDVIVTGGTNVYSTEVEEVIDQHPDVAEVAAIGIPDEEWGEAVHAVVVPASGADPAPEDIEATCDERLSDYKKPKSIELVEEIPKTPYGKQDKVALRDRHWEDQDRHIA